MLHNFLSRQYGPRLQLQEKSPDMEGSCEYVELNEQSLSAEWLGEEGKREGLNPSQYKI